MQTTYRGRSRRAGEWDRSEFGATGEQELAMSTKSSADSTPRRLLVFSQRCEGVGVDSHFKWPISWVFEAVKREWISARIGYPPVLNNVAGRSQNGCKKCQQNCQQISSRVVRGQVLRSTPASYGNSPISMPKGRGEGRRFRPSPPPLGKSMRFSHSAFLQVRTSVDEPVFATEQPSANSAEGWWGHRLRR
jgi:hypothetical protein